MFAEKGDLFGGARIATGTADAVVAPTPHPQVETLSEPEPLPAPPTDDETNRRVALELIYKTLELPEGQLGRYHGELVAALATIKPEQAFEISAQRGGEFDEAIFRALGNSLLLESPDEAIAYLMSVEDTQRRVYLLRTAAERLVPVDPERAKQELLMLMPDLAQLEPKYRAAYQARCGETLYKLDPEAAEPIIREAEEIAKTLRNSDWDAYARGCVAEALCQFDLEAALALIANLTGDYEPTRHQPNIAARIAADQPERAAELMEVLDGWNYGRRVPRVVYTMAPAHPDSAFELAETVEQPMYRARCLAYIALALRESAPDRALEAFARAVALMRDAGSGDRFGGVEAREGSVVGAELAYLAVKIGYPAVDRLVWHAIARRPAPSNEPWAQDSGVTDFLKPLAFVRPELAAQLIRDSVARRPLDSYEQHSDAASNLILAAAAADANLAAEMVRSLRPPNEEDNYPRVARHRLSVIQDLLIPDDERETTHYADVMGRYGTWVPGTIDAD